MEAAQLEHLVREAHEDPARRDALLETLRGAKVAVLLDRGLEDGQLAPQARPLVLHDRDGHPVLAAFTSVEKGKPWVQREPEYGFALYTQFEWVVRIAPAGVGIALNPGYRFHFGMAAEQVQAMKQQIRAAPGADSA